MWELIEANRRKSLVLFISMGITLLLLGYFFGSAFIPMAEVHWDFLCINLWEYFHSSAISVEAKFFWL